MQWPKSTRCVLLDMNGTFMFGGDRFGEGEDFYSGYLELGGEKGKRWVGKVMRGAFEFLEERYPDPEHRYGFPTVAEALVATCGEKLSKAHLRILVEVFARQELGEISEGNADAIRSLASRFRLGLVADVWAPPEQWKEAFSRAGILDCFDALSFSSEIGMVKPAHEPFEYVLEELGVKEEEAVHVGDSVKRDLSGAVAAGIGCVLVGGEKHRDAVGCFGDLAEFVGEVME